MLLVDPRRLTGPNLLARRPLVVVELALDVADVLEHARDVYLQELGRMRVALGLSPDVTPIVRSHRGGAVIAYEEAIDTMLPCTEMSEWAALSACEILGGRAPFPLEPKRTEVEAMLAHDRSPNLLALEAEAARRGLPFLWDDDVVSAGAGSRSASWPRQALPEPGAVAWDALGSIPIALITGTNGKTTSSRLLSRIVREAGIRVGSTSSDAITVGDHEIEQGDWTGPAAARAILRHPEVDFAVLETARGGILRRGLAMDHVDAAMITNVSEDHTGGYGIDDLVAMTRVKAVAIQAVRKEGTVVLNAADPKLVPLVLTLDCAVTFFADLDTGLDAARVVVEAHRSRGGRAVFSEGGAVLAARGDDVRTVLRIDEAPITFGGAARHNVENVLGAVAMAEALGIPDATIAAALRAFQPHDNPRRGDVFERPKSRVRVMLDFGHNPDGIRKILGLVGKMRGKSGRLFVALAAAGDRSDHEIVEMAHAVADVAPHRVILRELGGYLRGRLPGDVPRVLRQGLLGFGIASSAISMAPSEADALRTAIADAHPGDFVLVLVHLDRAEVTAVLSEAGFR